MLLPDNIHPNHSVYFNGAFVLKALQIKNNQGLLVLYLTVKKEAEITFAVFVLCLDWLFLLDVAILNKKGEVELCS
jgi:hypothetical protein